MRLFALFFLAGTACLQQAAALPPSRTLGLAAACLLAVRLARSAPARAVLLAAAGLVAGCDLAAWRAEVRLADELPRAWEGRDIEIEGVVSGLPQPGERGTRFLFDPVTVHTPDAVVPTRLSLTWYGARGEEPGEIQEPPPAIRAGERWRLTARLKRPRGLANPHGFDFEPWALERGLRATGYVRAAPVPVMLEAHVPGWPQTLHRWRGDIREAMQASLGEAPYAGVLVALAVGDQDAIAGADWTVFWRTGVGHLVSISGLHVTMFASLAFAATVFAWVRIPRLALAWPARKAGAVAGALAALAYTLLAGYGVPAQRTLVMLTVAALCLLADRHTSPSRVLAAAVLAVLLLDPWAVLSPGFWLSFGAVAAIFFAIALRTGQAGPIQGALLTQAAVTLALLPILASLFGEVSLVSPVANAFAIPVVSLVIVPLTIAGALLPVPYLLEAAHWLMEMTMLPLAWLASLLFAVMKARREPLVSVACCPRRGVRAARPARRAPAPCRAALLLPLATWRAPAPATGEAWIDILDVGQGLAVVVRTAAHALAYDAGPSWTGESDSGNRIVVPFLRGEGVRRYRRVDHHPCRRRPHGGAPPPSSKSREPPLLVSPLSADDERRSLAPESRATAWRARAGIGTGSPSRSCTPMPRRFATGAGKTTAPASCAWRRPGRDPAGSRHREGRRARALRARAVPCARRRCSSCTTARARRPRPRSSMPSRPRPRSSVGWRNRFRHPSPVVLARYRERGIAILRTDLSGALHVELPAVAGEKWRLRHAGRARRY